MNKQHFQAMKFRVESHEHSKNIQEHLFSLGYKWNVEKGDIVRNYGEDALYTDTGGHITWSHLAVNGEDYFEEQTHPEYTLVEHTAYLIEPVPVKDIKDVEREKKMKELQDAISEMEWKLKGLRKMVEEEL